jgi:urease gamma subunit
MNKIPITDLYGDSDEEYQNAEEEESHSTDEDDDASQPTDGEESQAKEQQFDNMTEKKTAEKLAYQHRWLLNKHKTLLAKRDARLENVNVLHKKLLSTWSDKMKCQQEYGHQYMRSIETSKIVWESKMTADNTRNNSRLSSNGRSQMNQETLAQEKERCAKQRVEQLAKDLLEATEKRMRTLEEVISLISRELNEAKQDCHALNKELVATEVQLLETEDVLETLNESEEIHVDKSFLAGTSTQCSETNRSMLRKSPQTKSFTYKSETEKRETILRKRSAQDFNSFRQDSGEIKYFLNEKIGNFVK